MLRAIIVDDEESARETLFAMLQKFCPQVTVIAEAGTIDHAIKVISAYKPDIIFLDICLPNGTGFDILERLDSLDFELIFTTAFDRYALKAIKFSALDYLLKPINPVELKAAIDQIQAKTPLSSDLKTELQNFFKQLNLNPKNKPNKIIIPTTDGFSIIQISEIIRCEGEKNYTVFYLENGTKPVVSKTLKEYEEMLHEHDFLRIFKSHLINLSHVRRYIKGRGGEVVMSDGKQLPVSRERKNELLEKLNSI